MDKIGQYAVPLVIGLILLFGSLRKTEVFSAFCEGAAQGWRSLWSLAPTLLGLVIGVRMLTASGFFELAAPLFRPLCEWTGFPEEVLPLCLLKPVSGSGSLAFLSDILRQVGPDSFSGKVASVIAASTETTFYTVSVYFGAVGVKKTGCVLPAALIGNAASFVLAFLLVYLTAGNC